MNDSTQRPASTTTSDSARSMSALLRWVIFVGLVPLSFVVLLALPFELRSFFIALMGSIVLLIGMGWLARQSVSVTQIRHSLQRLYPLITVASIGLMLWSTISLLQNRLVVDTGSWLFLGGGVLTGLALWIHQDMPLPYHNLRDDLRGLVRLLLMSLLLVVLVGLAAGFVSSIPSDWRFIPIVFFIGAVLVIGVFANRSYVRWIVFLPGVALLTLAIQSNIIFYPPIPQWIESLHLNQLTPHQQMMMFVAGCLLVAWGLGGGWRVQPTILDHIWKPHYLVLLLVLIIAFAARTWNLEEGVHRFVDEIHYARAVVDLGDMTERYIFHPFQKLTAFSWLYPYLQYLAVQVAGPSLTTLRIVSAIIGTLHVMALYALGKTLFNRKVGLLAAFVFATLPVHIHFSRMGINNIVDPFVGTLAILFLVRGFRSEQPREFVLAGVSLALTQYFYEGGRIFFPLFIAGFLAWLTFFGRRDKAFIMPHFRNLLLLITAFLILSLPLYYTWLTQGFSFIPRFDEQSFQGELSVGVHVGTSLERLGFALRGIVQLADWSWLSWFYGGDQALLLPGLVPFFLAGVVHCFWRLRRVEGILLFGWLVAAILGNGLLKDSLAVPRYVVVFPVLVLLVAAGVQYTLSLLQEISGVKKISSTGIVLVLAIGFGIYQLTYYFGIHLPGYYQDQFYAEFDEGGLLQDIEDALFRALLLPDNTRAIVVSRNVIWDFDSTTVVEFWERTGALQVVPIHPEFFNDEYLQRLMRDQHYAFFIEPSNFEALRLLRRYFVLEDVQLSPYAIPFEKQLHLYFARLGKNALPPVETRDT